MKKQDDRDSAARKLFNTHGYGFQYAVIDAWANLPPFFLDSVQCSWALREAEVPVTARGKEIHIDGIFELHTPFQGGTTYAVLETKRPDPSYREWVFARSGLREEALVDVFAPSTIRGQLRADAAKARFSRDEVFDICLERKLDDETGNSLGKGFDFALSQSLRSAAGLAQLLVHWLKDSQSALVVPVIVTNATLHYTDVVMSSADLATGDLASMPLKERPWLWLSANVTPSLMPEVERYDWAKKAPNPIATRLRHFHTRGVMVITQSGLEAGLRALAAKTYSWDLIDGPGV